MNAGGATSTTSMDVVKVGLEKQVGIELGKIQQSLLKILQESF